MAQDDFIRTALRVPPDLHKELHAAADASGRSFNAEIIERLQRTFRSPAEGGNDEVIQEMRRTQLHLQINTLKQELGVLFARGQEARKAIETADLEGVRAAEKVMDEISREKKSIDARAKEVLARLAELDALRDARQGAEPKSSTASITQTDATGRSRTIEVPARKSRNYFKRTPTTKPKS